MRKLLILFSQFLILNSFAQATWSWAKSGGGQGNDNGFSVASDASGNSYAIGTFRDTANFGSFTLISKGGADVYVAKYDPAGNCLWAKSGGDSLEDDEGKGIDVDAAGNVYVTGTFFDTASFGNLTLITSASQSQMFIVKYDSNGNELWARQGNGVYSVTTGADIQTDASGNSYVTGLLGGSNNIFGSFTLPGSGSYVVEYDAAGNVIWATELGSNFVFRATSIALDPFGETYIAGNFQGTETIGSQTYSSSSNNDLFICKFSAAGNFIWMRTAGGTSSDYCLCNSISVDGNGNPFIAGDFQSSLAIGTSTLTTPGPIGCSEIFIAKYDSTGNPLWAKQSVNIATTYPYNKGNDIVTDASGNSYITGNIYGTTIFGNDTIQTAGYSGYVIKYSAAGNPLWINTFLGGSSVSMGISINNNGGCYITGFSKTPLTFGTHTTAYIGAEDIFVAKLDEPLESVYEQHVQYPVTVYENQNGNLIIDANWIFQDENEIRFSLFDMSGREVKNSSVYSSSTQIETTELSRGIYSWEISGKESGHASGKIILR